jgi:uncharacterized protein YbjQ (UPF0145 family)
MSPTEEDDEPADPGESPAEQAESLARVERGGIPLGAERRLRELGEHGGAFTSDLSVGDFALCHQLGLKPMSQVMGSSIYQVGYQATPWPSAMGGGFMFEMEALSQAWNEVRDLALGRLAQEAGHVGADAVVGVDLRTGEHDWAENAIEYVVIGTAIRHEKTAVPGGPPVLTELSVADYAKLLSAGVEPLGVVAWSSVFFVGASYSTQMMSGVGGLGVYSARESVVARLTQQAAKLGASGVIGVRIAHGIQRTTVGGGTYSRGGLMVTFHAIGTAIREDRARIPYAPETIVDLTT